MESGAKTNQQFISVRGKTGTITDLNMGDDVTVTVTVVEISDRDNNNGTVDRTFKCQLFAPEEWDGKTVELKRGKMSLSQEQRWELQRYWEEKTDKSVPFNMYYSKYMQKKIDEIREKR